MRKKSTLSTEHWDETSEGISRQSKQRARAHSIIVPRPHHFIGRTQRLYSLVPTYTVSPNLHISDEEKIYFPILADMIQRGDLEAVKRSIHGADVEKFDRRSMTSFLHVAARFSDGRTWGVLAGERGVLSYLNRRDLRGANPLMAAVWYNNLQAVTHLLELGADPTGAIQDSKKNVLHLSASHTSPEICQLLLTSPRVREMLEELDSEGDSPLMLAVRTRSPVTDCLVAAGANLNVRNPLNGRNLFHVSVAFENYDFLQFLLGKPWEREQLETADINEDTPLSLALTLADNTSVDLILGAAGELIYSPRCQSQLHVLIVDEKKSVVETIVKRVSNPGLFEVFDAEGKTPLLVAVELKKVRHIYLLHNVGVDFNTLNKYTADTVLHAAAYTHDEETIREVFKFADHEILSQVENNLGLTAYEVVLGNASHMIWKLWQQLGNIETKYQNSSEESGLFIAAKEGNYMLVMSHLLSNKFFTYVNINTAIDEEQMLRLEVKRMVYASDVYVAIGHVVERRGWETSPRQDHLFQKNAKGMNIFHACAIGGHYDCLRLLYNYCVMFKSNAHQLDAGDENGNTPLFYAVFFGAQDVARYLLKQGCSICRTNTLGWSPLHIIAGNETFFQVLQDVLEDCVQESPDQTDFTLSYKIFQPEGENQMKVVYLMYEQLRKPEYIKILTNPVIEYYILNKWSKIMPIVSFKLFINLMLIFSFTFYLFFTLCVMVKANKLTIETYRWMTICFAVMSVILNLPCMFYRKVHFIFYLIAPMSVLCYMPERETNRERLELAGLGLLLSWLTLIMGSHVTRMSFQVAVLQRILHDVLRLIPLLLIILTAFSLCFFVLFHEYYNFNSPLHTLLWLFVEMSDGNLDTPALSTPQSQEPIDQSREPILSPQEEELVKWNKELHSVLFEGSLLFLFHILVIICALNLLIGVAISGVTAVEQTGKLQKLRNYVQELQYWESFMESKFFTILNDLHMTWIFGVPNSLKVSIRLPSKIHPLKKHVPEFDVAQFKQMVFGKKHQLDKKRFFKNLWDEEYYEMTVMSRGRYIRRSSILNANINRLTGYQ